MTALSNPIWKSNSRLESSSFMNRPTRAVPSVKDVVVNVATSGRPDLLRRTLKSLSRCELPAGYKETVVIENGPRAGAEEVVRAAPALLNARYMHAPWANKSAAMNAALETLGDCLIVYFDDDVRLAPWTLCAYADTARRKGSACFYGGPLNVDYDSPPPDWLREYMPASATGWELDELEQRVDSPIFLGGNWAVFSDTLRAAGGFNVNRGPGSRLGSTGEETEMQRLLLEKGLDGVYVPSARVWHYVPRERCTPEWTIERNFKNGLQDGARAAGETGSRWGLPPWWITYRYIKGIIRSIMWSHSRDPELRFRAKNRRSYDRGLVCGLRRQYQMCIAGG